MRGRRAPLSFEATLECHAPAGLKLLSHAITGTSAACVWPVPKRLAGRRVSGRISIGLSEASPIARSFAVKLPKKL